MITLNSCPNCKSSNIEQHPWMLFGPDTTHEVMPGVSINASIVTRFSICQNCHLICQNPRLSDLEINKFYSGGFYRRMMDKHLSNAEKAEPKRAKIDTEIINFYSKKIGSHLDIGCGRGYLLEAIGAKVKVGIELDIGYVTAKDIVVYSDLTKVKPRSFDLVTAIHVLEHVADPFKLLQEMVRFVKDDGLVVVEVPSGEGHGKSIDFVHVYHFEPDVLKNICAKVGLRVLHTHFTPHLVLICKLMKDIK